MERCRGFPAFFFKSFVLGFGFKGKGASGISVKPHRPSDGDAGVRRRDLNDQSVEIIGWNL